MPNQPHFQPALFRFLRDLAQNNKREWFLANKERYEQDVKSPLLQCIAEFAPRLRKVSLYFVADPRPNGGSMFRIYRDTRFSKDKRPYKTVASAQFRHRSGKDVHAPGFYLHLEPGNVFGGVGLWQPDGDTQRAVRDAIVEKPAEWKRAIGGKSFTQLFQIAGDSLKRAPRGYDPEHPLIDYIQLKDFVAFTQFTERDACSAGFLNQYAAAMRAAKPMMQFLTKALGLGF